jgi:predicted ATPase
VEAKETMATVIDVTIEGLGGKKTIFNRKLHPNISVFFGRNGGGKTTLLRTIYSALRNNAQIIRDSPVQSASVTFESADYKKNYTRTLIRVSEEQGAAEQLNLPISADAKSGAPEPTVGTKWVTDAEDAGALGTYKAKYLPVSRLYSEALRQLGPRYSVSRLNRASVELMDDPAAAEPSLEASFIVQFNQRWAAYSNGLLAQIKKIQQNGIGSILQAVLLSNTGTEQAVAGDPEKAYVVAKSFFDRQPELSTLVRSKQQFLNYYALNPSLRAVMRTIESVEINIEEAQTQKTYLGTIIDKLFEDKTIKLNDSGIEISSDEGKPLGLAQLSTGEKQMLSLCVEVLSCDGDTTIIIDEPEMSLHVDWQKKLLSTLHLLNPTVQIIVATHSPEIMAEIDDGCIFRI